jgi:hypothetical protein
MQQQPSRKQLHVLFPSCFDLLLFLFLLAELLPPPFLIENCFPSWFSTNILWPSPSISHDSSGEATRDATSWLRPCKKETRQPREKQTQPKIIIRTRPRKGSGLFLFIIISFDLKTRQNGRRQCATDEIFPVL